MKRARFLTAFMVCVWLLSFGGLWKAVAEPDSPVLLGPGEDAASAIEALGPAAETDLNAALRLGWLLHVYANDNARATPLFERVAEAAPDNVWARFGLASVAKLEGDFAAVAEQMAAVVVECTVVMKTVRIPVEEYAAFRETCRTIDEKQSERIRISR